MPEEQGPTKAELDKQVEDKLADEAKAKKEAAALAVAAEKAKVAKTNRVIGAAEAVWNRLRNTKVKEMDELRAALDDLAKK